MAKRTITQLTNEWNDLQARWFATSAIKFRVEDTTAIALKVIKKVITRETQRAENRSHSNPVRRAVLNGETNIPPALRRDAFLTTDGLLNAGKDLLSSLRQLNDSRFELVTRPSLMSSNLLGSQLQEEVLRTSWQPYFDNVIGVRMVSQAEKDAMSALTNSQLVTMAERGFSEDDVDYASRATWRGYNNLRRITNAYLLKYCAAYGCVCDNENVVMRGAVEYAAIITLALTLFPLGSERVAVNLLFDPGHVKTEDINEAKARITRAIDFL